jgi:Transposase family tnp2/Domain of unknown function (DUF4218)/Transposase-associated domain
MDIDKSWMNARGIFLPVYRQGVRNFIEFARPKADSAGRIKCPCKRCVNYVYRHISLVEEHLLRFGMDKKYTRWVWHGEGDPYAPVRHEGHQMVMRHDDHREDVGGAAEPAEHSGIGSLLHDLHQGVQSNVPITTCAPESSSDHEHHIDEIEGCSEQFAKLVKDAREPLYPNCTKMSKLEFLIKLLNIKTTNRWSQKSFDENLALFKSVLPDGERLPKSYSETKTYMRELGLGYLPIHACKNDCILFYKENEQATECPKCGESRYKMDTMKRKKIPHKVLRYFPLIPRLQRLYMSKKTAEEMRWHHEQRVAEDNILSHPADSIVWKDFDAKHPNFASDPRNIRLGLATDGFNPFGNMSTSYSMWPVMLIPYNVSPWKCMKEPFIFMSLLIPGPTAPGNEIDVYLRPLIDDLKELWQNGVQTYDYVSRRNFKLHAALLWTINDFPAYGNLSGWSTKGYLACPICNKDTSSRYLKHGRKISFIGHRRFLPANHSWRTRYNQYFDGKSDRRPPPKELNGVEVLEQLEFIGNVSFGKTTGTRKRKRTEAELNWTKRSIFFELPYWKHLLLRHNLDVMHIEKNICDNVIGTVLNIPGKTKDNAKARLDLQDMGIRPELQLFYQADKYFIPPACYSLVGEEKKSFCGWFRTVKFPDAYASNASRYVGNNDSNISGMKSHDCHVMMQRLLPVVMRGYLSGDVQTALIELGLFFRELCCRKLKVNLIEKLQKDIVLILCKLEKIFPPSFFDVMLHLAVHLPNEALLAGPVHYRWMYPIER